MIGTTKQVVDSEAVLPVSEPVGGVLINEGQWNTHEVQP